jgi:hypothetical protein
MQILLLLIASGDASFSRRIRPSSSVVSKFRERNLSLFDANELECLLPNRYSLLWQDTQICDTILLTIDGRAVDGACGGTVGGRHE